MIRKEMEVLLREGRAVGNKQVSAGLEVQGYADAATWVYGQALAPTWAGEALLTVTEIRHVHRLIVRAVWDVSGPRRRPPRA